MVRTIRQDMPRIGFRKLYYLLYEPLQELKIGRDKFLSILKANHMLLTRRQHNETLKYANYMKSNSYNYIFHDISPFG